MSIGPRAVIELALASVLAAKAKANDAIRAVQLACPHTTVLERPSGVTSYQYIENSWFPAVHVCAECGLMEEKRNMTPLFNTYVAETKPRLKREADYKIDAAKLAKVGVNLIP